MTITPISVLPKVESDVTMRVGSKIKGMFKAQGVTLTGETLLSRLGFRPRFLINSGSKVDSITFSTRKPGIIRTAKDTSVGNVINGEQKPAGILSKFIPFLNRF